MVTQSDGFVAVLSASCLNFSYKYYLSFLVFPLFALIGTAVFTFFVAFSLLQIMYIIYSGLSWIFAYAALSLFFCLHIFICLPGNLRLQLYHTFWSIVKMNLLLRATHSNMCITHHFSSMQVHMHLHYTWMHFTSKYTVSSNENYMI